jgi:hypothetical protein
MRIAILFLAVATAMGQEAPKRLGLIEFFGAKGLDTAAVRASLPVHEGDPFDPMKFNGSAVKAAVTNATGHPPTDLGMVCCDGGGNFMLYIGLQGANYREVKFHMRPTGKALLSPEFKKAYDASMDAWGKAVMAGHIDEDRSQGYSLLKDPVAREKQLAFRELVLRDEKSVNAVLAGAAEDEQRAIAASALGYARTSEQQVAALVEASLDASDSVRNNAVRALVVLAQAHPDLARKIPPEPFLRLLSSGSWSDHNKGVGLLDCLTMSGEPKVLDLLRAQSMDTLQEMAHWRNPGHAGSALAILQRLGAVAK